MRAFSGVCLLLFAQPILLRGGKSVYGIGEFVPGPGATVRKILVPGHYAVSGPRELLLSSWVKSWIAW